jgi:hypothetical protein
MLNRITPAMMSMATAAERISDFIKFYPFLCPNSDYLAVPNGFS